MMSFQSIDSASIFFLHYLVFVLWSATGGCTSYFIQFLIIFCSYPRVARQITSTFMSCAYGQWHNDAFPLAFRRYRACILAWQLKDCSTKTSDVFQHVWRLNSKFLKGDAPGCSVQNHVWLLRIHAAVPPLSIWAGGSVYLASPFLELPDDLFWVLFCWFQRTVLECFLISLYHASLSSDVAFKSRHFSPACPAGSVVLLYTFSVACLICQRIVLGVSCIEILCRRVPGSLSSQILLGPAIPLFNVKILCVTHHLCQSRRYTNALR